MSIDRQAELAYVTNAQAAKKLEFCGVRRREAAYLVTGPRLYLLAILLSLIFAWILINISVMKEVATLFTTTFVALIGVHQWRSSKTEAALDKFYDRLTLTNERLRVWRNPRAFISEQWSKERIFEIEMYVCLELDNLEYVIQKYERGYMEPRDALREFTCFASRCHAGEFKELAVKVAARGGYKSDTKTALHRICSVCPREVCQHREALDISRAPYV